MVSDTDYVRERVPTHLLGLHWTSWTIYRLRIVLNHYGVSRGRSVSKLDLMRRLNRLVHDHNLNRFDRLQILSAHRRGGPLPTRKPKVLDATSVSAVRKISGTDCIVCFETLEPTAFPKLKTTGACTHKPDVCLQCLSSSITTQFTNKMWDQIDCPSCGERLGFMDVQAFADPVVFERQELAIEEGLILADL